MGKSVEELIHEGTVTVIQVPATEPARRGRAHNIIVESKETVTASVYHVRWTETLGVSGVKQERIVELGDESSAIT